MESIVESSVVPLVVPKYTGTPARILELLGVGVQPVQVASAVGCSESYISQLLAEEGFAKAVAQKRYDTLVAESSRDRAYDSIEDELLEKLRKSLPFIVKTPEILASIKVINGAKRRGASTSTGAAANSTVIQLVLPARTRARFTADSNGQVVEVSSEAGTQSLLTVQSSSVAKLLESHKQELAGIPSGGQL
jgi:hypothetical protein